MRRTVTRFLERCPVDGGVQVPTLAEYHEALAGESGKNGLLVHFQTPCTYVLNFASGAQIGCMGGNRYFEGIGGFLEIPKVQKMDFPKIPIIHAGQKDFKSEFAKNSKIPQHSWFKHKWSMLSQKYF